MNAGCTRGRFPWAAAVPKALFFEAVLPYANTNEARTNWRDLLWAELVPLMAAGGPTNSSLAAVAVYLNEHMWEASVLGRHNANGAKITFHGEMTPRVYDPMSTLLFGACNCDAHQPSLLLPVEHRLCCRDTYNPGYASCTGVSILYVDALRAIGVPARVTGTPAWCDTGTLQIDRLCQLLQAMNANALVLCLLPVFRHGGPGGASGPPQGNHNWVEVFVGKAYGGKENVDGWAFIEALPAGGGETLTNPCDKWFCSKTKGYGNGTRVYAAVFSKSSAQPGTYYPMEWEPTNKGVPGVERTDIYAEWCNRC
eukprot:COSAG02_NODE_1589_length_11792_cov_203.500898_3_plen_311_part_00